MTPAAILLGREILADAPDGAKRIRYIARPEFANRHGTVQGGFLSAMLDSATSAVLLAQLPRQMTSITAKLETSFLKPAPLGELIATARLVSREENRALAEAELATPDGAIVARATAELRIRLRKT
jgi:uncharacterized protein (TIGR00369 family)